MKSQKRPWMKVRAVMGRILAFFFSIETLSLALQARPDVLRMEVLANRDMNHMEDYFGVGDKKQKRTSPPFDFAVVTNSDPLVKDLIERFRSSMDSDREELTNMDQKKDVLH